MQSACSSNYPLSQSTVLAYLPSFIDPNNILVVATGLTMSIVGVDQATIAYNVAQGIWAYIETESPRDFLIADLSAWTITSFNPTTGMVCITYNSPYGNRFLSINLPIIRKSLQ